jgi:hypothetical protein
MTAAAPVSEAGFVVMSVYPWGERVSQRPEQMHQGSILRVSAEAFNGLCNQLSETNENQGWDHGLFARIAIE